MLLTRRAFLPSPYFFFLSKTHSKTYIKQYPFTKSFQYEPLVHYSTNNKRQELPPSLLNYLEQVRKQRLHSKSNRQDMIKQAEREIDKEMGKEIETQLSVIKNNLQRIIGFHLKQHNSFQVFRPLATAAIKQYQQQQEQHQKQQEQHQKQQQSLVNEQEALEARKVFEEYRRQVYGTLLELVEYELLKLIDLLEQCLVQFKRRISQKQEEEEAAAEESEAIREAKAFLDQQQEREEEEVNVLNRKMEIEGEKTHMERKEFLSQSTELTKIFIQLFTSIGIETITLYTEFYYVKQVQKEKMSLSEYKREMETFKQYRNVYLKLSTSLYQTMRRAGMLTSVQYKQLPSFIEDDFLVPLNSLGLWHKLMELIAECRDTKTAVDMLTDMREMEIQATPLLFRHLFRLLINSGKMRQIPVLLQYMKKVNIQPDSVTNELLMRTGLLNQVHKTH